MSDQHRVEQLRTESEARAAAAGESTSSWRRAEAALRRYLTVEGYRKAREESAQQEPTPTSAQHRAEHPETHDQG